MSNEGFDYEITADPSKSVAALKQNQEELEKTEVAAKEVGKAIEEGFSSDKLRDAQGRFSATAVAAKQAADAVNEFGYSAKDQSDQLDQFTRTLLGTEKATGDLERMYQKIHGPLEQYTNDLNALDQLLARDLITVGQYTDQLTRMNQELARKQPRSALDATEAPAYGPVFNPAKAGVGPAGSKTAVSDTANLADDYASALASKLGPVGDVLESIVSSEAVAAAAVVALGAALVGLGNGYIEVSNQAQRLAVSGQSVDGILSQQLEQSEQLHGSLSGMIAVTAGVRETTDQLGLSQRQQTNLTREITEAVQLSGHAFGDTAGLVKKLGFAFEQGTVGPRELRGIMREYPSIGAIFEESLHTNAAGLLALAKQGKITAQDLIDAFDKAGGSLDERFSHRVETTSEQWQHFKDSITLSVGSVVESTGVIEVLGSALKILSDILGGIAGVVSGAIGALRAVGSAASDLTGGVLSLNAGAAIGFAAGGPLGAAVGSFAQNLLNTNGVLDIAKKAMADYAAEQKTTADAVDRLNQFIVNQGSITATQAKLLESIQSPLRTYSDEIHDLEVLFGRGSISADQYTAKINKLNASLQVSGADKVLNEFANKARESQAKIQATADAMKQIAGLIDRVESESGNPAGVADAVGFYANQQHAIGRLQEDAIAEQMKNLHTYGAVVDEITGKEVTRERKIEDLSDALKVGAISQEQFNKAVDGLGLPSDNALGILTKYESKIDELKRKQAGFAAAKAANDARNAAAGALGMLGVPSDPGYTRFVDRGAIDAQRELDISLKSYGATGEEVIHTVDHLTHSIQDLREMVADTTGRDHAEAVIKLNAALKQLEGPLSEMQKLINRLVKEASQFENSIAALDFAAPRLSLLQYNEELERLIKNYKNEDFAKVFAKLQLDLSKQEAAHPTAAVSGENKMPVDYSGGVTDGYYDDDGRHAKVGPSNIRSLTAGLGPASYESDTFMAGDTATDKQINSLERDLKLSTQAATAAQKYAEEVAALHVELLGSNVPLDQQAQLFKKIHDQYDDMKPVAERYNDDLVKAKQNLDGGIYTLDEYRHKLTAIANTYNDVRDPAKKYAEAIAELNVTSKAIGMTTDEVARKVEKLSQEFNQNALAQFTAQLRKDADTTTLEVNLMKTGFDDLAKGIYNVAITGKESFGDMVGSLLDDLAQLIIKAELAKVALALIGNAGAPNPLTGGGALGGVLSGVAHIVGFASGGYILGGGSGGTDSQTALVRYSPGERIDFTPPGQIPGFALGHGGGGSPAPVIVHTHVHNHYDRRELYAGIGSTPAGQRGVFNALNKVRRGVNKTLGS